MDPKNFNIFDSRNFRISLHPVMKSAYLIYKGKQPQGSPRERVPMLVGTMLFAVILFPVALIAFVIVLILWSKENKKDDYYNFMTLHLIIASVVLGVSLLILAISAAPFNSKFWSYTAQTSTISSVENKVVTSGNDSTSLTSEFVLTLEDDNEAVVLTDSRIQTYEAGDTINLNCSYGWVYGGMDVKNCKILG